MKREVKNKLIIKKSWRKFLCINESGEGGETKIPKVAFKLMYKVLKYLREKKLKMLIFDLI